MAEEPLLPDHGELLQGSYEAVHFPAPVSTGDIFNFPLEPCLWSHSRANCSSQKSWLSGYPGCQRVFLAFPAFDLKWETLTSFPLKQSGTIRRLLTGRVSTSLCLGEGEQPDR